MEITRETDYAIRCVLFLSRNYNVISMIDEISRETSASKSFLAKILQKLSKAGIVKSFRGVKGGFQLTKNPEQISLLDIITVTQGPVAMNRCAVDKEVCSFSCTCSVHPVWVELRHLVEEYLGNTDFSQLVTAHYTSGHK